MNALLILLLSLMYEHRDTIETTKRTIATPRKNRVSILSSHDDVVDVVVFQNTQRG
jgi:hypothetical protein